MEKKGVSMFPFVIMFVMIAGAIILFFFFGFAKNIKKQGDTVNDLEIVNLIEKNLDSFTLAENSYKNIPHNGLPPKAEISVSCLDNKKTRIKLKDSYRDTVKLIVAPTVLKEKQISAWTLAWNYPFKIDNFYYLANNKIVFYLDPNLRYTEIYGMLPQKFIKKDIISATDADIGNYDSAIFIYMEGGGIPISHFSAFKDNPRARGILIDTTDSSVTFFENAEKTSPYWGLPLVFAAIFAENFQEYECIKDFAHKRLKVISEVYKNKLGPLKGGVQGNNICIAIYDRASELIGVFEQNPSVDNEAVLIKLNQELIGKQCPSLF